MSIPKSFDHLDLFDRLILLYKKKEEYRELDRKMMKLQIEIREIEKDPDFKLYQKKVRDLGAGKGAKEVKSPEAPSKKRKVEDEDMEDQEEEDAKEEKKEKKPGKSRSLFQYFYAFQFNKDPEEFFKLSEKKKAEAKKTIKAKPEWKEGIPDILKLEKEFTSSGKEVEAAKKILSEKIPIFKDLFSIAPPIAASVGPK